MSRCIVCDASTDTDGGHLRMTFNKKKNGYECENCLYEIFSSIEELEQRDREIAQASEEGRPHVSGSGEVEGLSIGFGTLRQEEENYPMPVQFVQDSSDS